MAEQKMILPRRAAGAATCSLGRPRYTPSSAEVDRAVDQDTDRIACSSQLKPFFMLRLRSDDASRF